MKRFLLSVVMLTALILLFAQCEAVKPYQRVYLNDSEMKMGQAGAKIFEENVHAYREGAVGGGSIKVSGGCGCN